MSELITLDRADRRFLDYMRGTFSDSHRAIPLISQSIGSSKKEFVFEIKDVENLSRPTSPAVWWKALRPNYFTLSMTPVLVAIFYCLWQGLSINPVLATASVMAVFLLQAAAHFLNDYYDHMNAVDHVRWRGSQIIQNGWLPAHRLQQAGWFSFSLAIAFGVPALVSNPELITGLGLVAAIGVIKFSAKSFGFKYLGFGELVLFVLTGPALMIGLTWTFSGQFNWDVVVLGCVLGLLSSVSYFLKNLEEIIVEESSHLNSLARRLGFDASKRLVTRILFFVPLTFLAWGFYRPEQQLIWSILAIASLPALFKLVRSISDVESCLSSGAREVRRMGLRLHATIGLSIAIVFAAMFLLGR